MKTSPQGSSFEFAEFPRSGYLKLVSERLTKELGYYLELIEAHPHPSGAGVGFWSGVRLIMPVIEAVAEVEKMSVTDFMGQKLNVPMPALTWVMFRHSLMHNDQLQHAIYGTRIVNWGLSLNLGSGHIMRHDNIHVDIRTLYDDLQNYLRYVVDQNDSTLIQVAVGFKYDKPPTTIANELQLLKA